MITKMPNILLLGQDEMNIMDNGGYLYLTFVGTEFEVITLNLLKSYQFEEPTSNYYSLSRIIIHECVGKLKEKGNITVQVKFNKLGLENFGIQLKRLKNEMKLVERAVSTVRSETS